MGGLKRGRRLNCSENSINGYLFWVKEKLSYWLEIWGVLSSKLTISISKDQRSIFDLPILCEKNVGVFHISLEWVKKKKKISPKTGSWETETCWKLWLKFNRSKAVQRHSWLPGEEPGQHVLSHFSPGWKPWSLRRGWSILESNPGKIHIQASNPTGLGRTQI